MVPFHAKTVGGELEDAKAVIQYMRDNFVPAPAPIHVVGLSTGAIVASLLRGFDPHISITAIAGLLDVNEGLHLDFDEQQLASFANYGWCLKEFWLPAGSPSNPPTSGKADVTVADDAWQKTWLRLDVTYRENFLGLNIYQAVQATSPFLVIHGEAGKNVPLAAGLALHAAAAEPKSLLLIPGGNHLLTNSKHFKRACRAFAEHARMTELIRRS